MKKEMWFPDDPSKMREGHDITKMITEQMAFVDSRSETLIQAVDVLTSFLRRLLGKSRMMMSHMRSEDCKYTLGERVTIHNRSEY